MSSTMKRISLSVYAIHKPEVRPWEKDPYETLAERSARLQALRDYRESVAKKAIIEARHAAGRRFIRILDARHIARGEFLDETSPADQRSPLKRKSMGLSAVDGPPLAKICMLDVRGITKTHPGYSVNASSDSTYQVQLPAPELSSFPYSLDPPRIRVRPSPVILAEGMRFPKKLHHESFAERIERLKITRAIRARTRSPEVKLTNVQEAPAHVVHRRRAHGENYDVYECDPGDSVPKRKRANHGIRKPDVLGYTAPTLAKLRTAHPLEVPVEEAQFTPAYFHHAIECQAHTRPSIAVSEQPLVPPSPSTVFLSHELVCLPPITPHSSTTVLGNLNVMEADDMSLQLSSLVAAFDLLSLLESGDLSAKATKPKDPPCSYALIGVDDLPKPPHMECEAATSSPVPFVDLDSMSLQELFGVDDYDYLSLVYKREERLARWTTPEEWVMGLIQVAVGGLGETVSCKEHEALTSHVGDCLEEVGFSKGDEGVVVEYAETDGMGEVWVEKDNREERRGVEDAEDVEEERGGEDSNVVGDDEKERMGPTDLECKLFGTDEDDDEGDMDDKWVDIAEEENAQYAEEKHAGEECKVVEVDLEDFEEEPLGPTDPVRKPFGASEDDDEDDMGDVLEVEEDKDAGSVEEQLSEDWESENEERCHGMGELAEEDSRGYIEEELMQPTGLEKASGDDEDDEDDGNLAGASGGVIDPQLAPTFTSDSFEVLKIIQEAVASASLPLDIDADHPDLGPDVSHAGPVAPLSSSFLALFGNLIPSSPDRLNFGEGHHIAQIVNNGVIEASLSSMVGSADNMAGADLDDEDSEVDDFGGESGMSSLLGMFSKLLGT
ncbi:hypothetical protein BV22DRAFT_1128366 [Leucogyrophana mollusca]|uniref:Uncharacterized protein n=1 Tax=Leucogyrophana mollusca TaxID=85980 RepID=A0ACB8BKR3_9AGAM|nr:hypothetical protein BV22DRAFT_1128366 [Leucogyrophana mollusca]